MILILKKHMVVIFKLKWHFNSKKNSFVVNKFVLKCFYEHDLVILLKEHNECS